MDIIRLDRIIDDEEVATTAGKRPPDRDRKAATALVGDKFTLLIDTGAGMRKDPLIVDAR